MSQDTIDQLRLRIHPDDESPRGNYRYVDVPEFITLATSTRKFIRSDEVKAGLHGLLDPLTGDRVFVERSKLLESSAIGPTGCVPTE